MNINVHVERLILDGLPIGRHEVPLLQRALEGELAALFAQGFEGRLPSGGAVGKLSAQMPMATEGTADPGGWGRRLAGAVHGAIRA